MYNSYLSSTKPTLTRKQTEAYLRTVGQRIKKRVRVMGNRRRTVATGRTMPAPQQVLLGSGKQMELAILFLDICRFSDWPNATFEQQETTLNVLQVFLPEMMTIVRDCAGKYEKNTGDGLMAYFGTETRDSAESVRPAIKAATLMHVVNDTALSPLLQSAGLWPIRFRVGVDFGEVTIGRIGVKALNSLAAVGLAANIACKLMEFVPEGGIILGEAVHELLPYDWQDYCREIPNETGFVRRDQLPYRAWRLDYTQLVQELP